MDTDTTICSKNENHTIRKFINEILSSSSNNNNSALHSNKVIMNDDNNSMDIENNDNNDSSSGMMNSGIDTHKTLFFDKFKSVPKLQFSSGAASGVSLMDTKW